MFNSIFETRQFVILHCQAGVCPVQASCRTGTIRKMHWRSAKHQNVHQRRTTKRNPIRREYCDLRHTTIQEQFTTHYWRSQRLMDCRFKALKEFSRYKLQLADSKSVPRELKGSACDSTSVIVLGFGGDLRVIL